MNTTPTPPLKLPAHWEVFPPSPVKTDDLPSVPTLGKRTRILIADDDRIGRELLSSRLRNAGYEVIATSDGEGALGELRKPDAPSVAILDWLMPGADGPSICRRMRDISKSVYLILLTSRDRKEDVVEGLDSGADDYLVKPFQTEELLARVKVGLRIIGMQRALTEKLTHLESPESGAPRGPGVAIL